MKRQLWCFTSTWGGQVKLFKIQSDHDVQGGGRGVGEFLLKKNVCNEIQIYFHKTK